jgi:CrcB protein
VTSPDSDLPDHSDDPRRRHRHDPHPGFPVDSDVTEADVPTVPERALRLLRTRRDILLAIAAGGALGAAARWGLAYSLPHARDEFPWSTLLANVAGCFAIGVLMVIVVERRPDSRLVRPFFGTGLLAGFTTFSTYAVDTRNLLATGRPALAAAYVLGTLALGLLAVVVALRATEQVLR